MSGDLGKKVHFKGPGQWRSQADKAQTPRPPAAFLDPPGGEPDGAGADRPDAARRTADPGDAAGGDQEGR